MHCLLIACASFAACAGISVRDMGAVGDGVADDTAAFEKAISQGKVAGECDTGKQRNARECRVGKGGAMDFVKTAGNMLVLERSGATVRLKGTNFQTPYHPHFFFTRFDFDWVERGMAQVEALGMNCVRQLIGVRHGDYVGAFTKYLEVAERHKVRVFAIPDWPHKYAEKGTLEDKANLEFVRELVGAVKDDPRVLAWDMANEPDWVSHDAWQWDQDRPEAERRLKWFARMKEEIKKIDSNHPISVGATFNYSYWMPDRPFTLESIVDFVDFHYYRRNNREHWLGERIRQMKEHTDKPIIIGEFGFPTDPTFHIHGEPEHNEELQLEFYRRYIADITTEGIGGFIQWALTDCNPGLPEETSEGTYGILRMDMSWKPAAELIKAGYVATRW